MTVAVATEPQRTGRDWNRNLRLLRHAPGAASEVDFRIEAFQV